MSSQEIRNALVVIAEKLGRPHYELCAVRQVVQSFANNSDHPLKTLVMRELGMLTPKPELVAQSKPVKKDKLNQQAKIETGSVHGTLTQHSNGCRCDECAAWAQVKV